MEVVVPQRDVADITVNPRGTCKTCIYSELMTEVDDDFDEENVDKIQCHRYAPITGYFSILKIGSWCGDYSNGNGPQKLEIG